MAIWKLGRRPEVLRHLKLYRIVGRPCFIYPAAVSKLRPPPPPPPPPPIAVPDEL